MNLDALRSLQEQASPGEWRLERPEDELVSPPPTLAEGCLGEIPRHRIWGPSDNGFFTDVGSLHTEANAKLAALATHLLPIAEALHCSHDHNAGTEECLESDACTVPCPQCKALKDLMEALDG